MKVNLLLEFDREKYYLTANLKNYDINFQKHHLKVFTGIPKILNYKPVYK